MASWNNAPAGPSTLSGAQNVGVNEMHTVVAGGDVHRNTPVFNFNGLVQIANPSFGSTTGNPTARNSQATLAPQRFGIVKGLSRWLTWLQDPAPQDPVIQDTAPPELALQGTSSTPEVEDDAIDRQRDSCREPNSSQENVSLSLLQDIENESVDWHRLRSPEVYVFRMLNSMRGLPCWQPDPQGLAGPHGVIPGDVGTYNVGDGFMKLWNIWDDEEAVQRTAEGISNVETYIAPQGRRTLRIQVFDEGDTVAEGPTATTIPRPCSDRIERFEFGCQGQPQGAVLALTAPAFRERLYNHTSLRKHIVRNAETIYIHSNSLRDIEEDEALYIITGSVKSESWGLAAFSNPMNDTIMLEHLSRRPPDEAGTESTFYRWTRKGTAEARLGSSEIKGAKDQALFLEGFKLDFSRSFRANMEKQLNPSSRGRDGPEGGSDPSGCSGGPSFGGCGGPEGDLSDKQPPSGDAGTGGGGPTERSDFDGFRVEPFPDPSRGTSCHPCDIINEALLEITGSHFALSHDDDWLSIVECNSNSSLPVIYLQNGAEFSCQYQSYLRPLSLT
ncbi:hypothetical protein DFP72DRAFT_108382 [Ephemerocybe angulata]|uniref:Uncharacterized protein n=1 Tax=Ephemerocybe angulata TaxID=980116 RepID=A0A8H6LWL5_9AGAR|nr:hypothetical protein DFP72DRAFT_108382 [Tulosesus angulatus]